MLYTLIICEIKIVDEKCKESYVKKSCLHYTIWKNIFHFLMH